MVQAKANDRDSAIEIIVDSFWQNPSVLNTIKGGTEIQKKRQITTLAGYAFDYGLRRNGVWFSSDKSGIAICYEFGSIKENLNDLYGQIALLFKTIGITRIGSVLTHEKELKNGRNTTAPFLYFWFYGVKTGDQGKGAALELKNGIFQLSQQLQLPIYAETSVPKNYRVYQRYGFECYHELKDRTSDNGSTLWFLKRPPDPA